MNRWAFLGFGVATVVWVGTGRREKFVQARSETRASAETEQERWRWSGRLAGGKIIEIRGVNGSVSAEPATGADVEVVAEKSARRSDPDDVTIEVVEHESGVTICAVYPNNGRRANRCVPGGGSMNTRNNDVQVDFTVRVPRGVAFEGATVNGDVEANGLTGAATVSTVNGDARLETSAGDASATTVNGSVTATVRAMGERSLRFTTVNGSVNLSLPATLSAELEASTVNGSITSDFPVQVQGRMSPRRMNGTIGQGGRSLHINTVNGSIRLRRLP